MHNHVRRVFVAAVTAVALLALPAAPAAAAPARTTGLGVGDNGCTYYAGNAGFGYVCATSGFMGTPQSWKQLLDPGQVFIPCKLVEIPEFLRDGIPPVEPPKRSMLKYEMKNVDLNSTAPPGGPDLYVFVEVVAADDKLRKQCRDETWMQYFWRKLEGTTYPPPVIRVDPIQAPRVNSTAYFSLRPDTAMVYQPPPKFIGNDGNEFTRMKGEVVRLKINPGDGSKPLFCNLVKEGYDPNLPNIEQKSDCKHTYKRSSATESDLTFRVQITIYWKVSYYKNSTDSWTPVGGTAEDPQLYEVDAYMEIPVQEVQGNAGG